MIRSMLNKKLISSAKCGVCNMNPKLKKKLILDSILVVTLLVVMVPALSGVFLHEWIGVVIAAGLVIHLVLNRKWIAGVSRKFLSPMTLELRLSYLMNLMLGLAMVLTLISGVLISQYLFTALNAADLALWTIIHAVASRATLGITIVHVLLHLSWIKNALKQALQSPVWQPIRQAVVRTTLGLFALGATYAVIQTSVVSPALATVAGSGAASTDSDDSPAQSAVETPATETTLQDTEDGSSVIDSLPAPGTDSGSNVTDGQDAAEAVSLNEYLSRFTCTACGRHCLLSAPKCGRARTQIQRATTEYNEIYGAE
ncbi:MAG: DUF4405 domain-containing protein [Clostridia bacterium]|nr:DUF4405 domain-containing protein [Clostridia bacterium]